MAHIFPCPVALARNEVDQLNTLHHRRDLLHRTWGFLCHCDRCRGGRPLDRRLEALGSGFSEAAERRKALAAVNAKYVSLFDASCDLARKNWQEDARSL